MRISRYELPFIIPSINSEFQTHLAPKQAHTTTDPPACFTVGRRFFVLSASPFFLHTFLCPSEPNRLTLVSSDQIIESQKDKIFET